MGQVDVWHTGVLTPSEVISDHYLSFNVSPRKQNISTFLKSTPRISSRQKKVTHIFFPACFKLFTNCFLTKVIPLQPHNFILRVLISNLFENGATTRKPVTQVLIFPALVFLQYIDFYLKVTGFSTALLFTHGGNILPTCIAMGVVWQRSDFVLCCRFLSLLFSPFVFVMSVTVSRSSAPPIKAAVLSPSLTLCLMFGMSAGLSCFVCDVLGFVCACVCVISIFLIPSWCCRCVVWDLSCLHRPFYLCIIVSVVPMLSNGTIDLVTSLSWHRLKVLSEMSQQFL